MPQCCFETCQRRNQNRRHSVSYHEFPKEEEIRAKWLCVVRSDRRDPRWTPDVQTRVCSLHFTRSQFLSKKVLHSRAVPSAKCDMVRCLRSHPRHAQRAGNGVGERRVVAASAAADGDGSNDQFPNAEELARAAEDQLAAAAPDPPACPDTDSDLEPERDYNDDNDERDERDSSDERDERDEPDEPATDEPETQARQDKDQQAN